MSFFLFIILLKTNTLLSQTVDTGFVLCGDKKSYPYFASGLKYKGDFYAIKKHFYNNFPANKFSKEPNNSGVIRIRFYVNCMGSTGNYSYDTYSVDYKVLPVNDLIIQELLRLTKELKDWIPTKNRKGEIGNTRKFFTFCIVNGELTDILPK